MSSKKINKPQKIYYNATEAAKFLGISRQFFYKVKRKYHLEPATRNQAIPLFSVFDLTRVKELRDER